jgi:hypothetical protein
VNLLRRAIFPIMIGCLAFAIGVALGGGPLQSDDTGDDNAALERDNTALKDQADSLRDAAIFDRAVNRTLSPQLLDKRLSGRGVSLFVLPGVDDATQAATERALELAGAEVPVVARLDADLINPGKKTYVDSVAASSIKGAPDLAKLVDASTYVRAGALIARAYTGHGSNANVDDEAARIDSELQGAKLVTIDGNPIRRGTFAVVLAPGDHGTDSLTTARMVITQDLVTALVGGSDAVVVGSTPTSASAGGLIDVLTGDQSLADKRFATVNVLDSAAGQTALVYALQAAASGAPGHYGVDGDEAVLPPGLAPKSD